MNTHVLWYIFFFQAEDGIRDADVTGVQTCALPISLGHHRRAVVRAARAEEGLARQRQRRGALAQRFQQGDPRGDGPEAELLLQARGQQQRDAVGVQLAVGGHERTVLLVLLADDARPVALGVAAVAEEPLHERALFLDDEDLLQAARELAYDHRLHRPQQPDLQQADAVTPQRLIVEPQPAQGPAQVVVRLAGSRAADPRLGG